MKLRTSYSRTSISLVVAMAIATVFTLSSFAAPEATKAVVAPALAQDCTGTLTVKAGQVTINGNAAQTGATVMTGSAITTSSNGKAIIDLGALGRVEVGDNTTVTLTCAGGSLQIRTNCSRTDIEVRRGTVDVKSPKAETLAAGKKAKYDSGVDATSTGGVDVKIECAGGKAAGTARHISPGLWGLLALVAVGGAVAIGIAVGSNDGAAASSPTRP